MDSEGPDITAASPAGVSRHVYLHEATALGYGPLEAQAEAWAVEADLKAESACGPPADQSA
jgi:hypothetical protein